MRTRQSDIRYCTNCRRTTHVTSQGRNCFSCDRCGATLYPFSFMTPDIVMDKKREENADEEKRRKQGDQPDLPDPRP